MCVCVRALGSVCDIIGANIIHEERDNRATYLCMPREWPEATPATAATVALAMSAPQRRQRNRFMKYSTHI